MCTYYITVCITLGRKTWGHNYTESRWYVRKGEKMKCSGSWEAYGSPPGWSSKEGIMEEVTTKVSLEGRVELRHAVVKILFLESAINTFLRLDWKWWLILFFIILVICRKQTHNGSQFCPLMHLPFIFHGEHRRAVLFPVAIKALSLRSCH